MHHNLCKNCEHTFEGNFCSNCGQKTTTKRLDWNYIYDELKYTFLHINGGLLFTCKQLLTRPGDMVREFLEGKRIKHYKPILLVFVLAGISTLLLHYSGDLLVMEKMNISNKKSIFDPKDFIEFFSKYYTYIQLASIPVLSLCTWLAFKKWNYNYIENTIINSFIISQLLLIGIIITPIKYLCIESDYYVLINTLLGFASYGFSIWLYIGLYRKRDLGFVILRMMLTGLYFIILIIIVIILSVLVGFVYNKFFKSF